METIYNTMPKNKRCPFLEEEEERLCERSPRQYPKDLLTCTNPLKQRDMEHLCSKKCRSSQNRRQFFDLLRRGQQTPEMESDEEENMDFLQCRRRQQLEESRNFPLTETESEQSRMWYTVVPLQVAVRPEEVKVKLNPRCHILVVKVTPRMALLRHSNTMPQLQQIHRLVTLPKTIRMEKIQVKLTPRGELIVLAPYKSQVQCQGRHSTNLLPPFFQEQEKEEQWISIPINKSRQQIKSRQQPFFRRFRGGLGEELSETESESSSSSESETETETESEDERMDFPFRRNLESETETETETESETESEFEDEDVTNEMKFGQKHFGLGRGRYQRDSQQNILLEQLERINIRTSIKVQVMKFVQLLEKIFYPNIVEVKLVPGEQKKQLQVVVNIKFADFTSEEIKVRMHTTQRLPVLIVEGKKVRKMRQFGAALKYVRREIVLPQVFNVKKVVYRVVENGTIRIKLPFLTNIISGYGCGSGIGKQHQLEWNEFTRRVNPTCPHMMDLFREPEQMQRQTRQIRQTRLNRQAGRNWKVLAQRCRPTTRRY